MKGDRIVSIHDKCKKCGSSIDVYVKFEDFIRWAQGEKVVHAYPYLSDAQKNAIIIGECEECYNGRLYGQNLFNMIVEETPL